MDVAIACFALLTAACRSPAYPERNICHADQAMMAGQTIDRACDGSVELNVRGRSGGLSVECSNDGSATYYCVPNDACGSAGLDRIDGVGGSIELVCQGGASVEVEDEL